MNMWYRFEIFLAGVVHLFRLHMLGELFCLDWR